MVRIKYVSIDGSNRNLQLQYNKLMRNIIRRSNDNKRFFTTSESCEQQLLINHETFKKGQFLNNYCLSELFWFLAIGLLAGCKNLTQCEGAVRCVLYRVGLALILARNVTTNAGKMFSIKRRITATVFSDKGS